MHRIFTLLALLTATLLPAQATTTLTARVTGCSQSPQLFVFTGAGFAPEETLAEVEPGVYRATLQLEGPRFRYLGTTAADLLPLIVGDEGELTVAGKCGQFRRAQVEGSPINTAYLELKETFDAFHERYTMLQQDIEVIRDARVNREGRVMMQELDAEKRALVDRLTSEYPLLGRIAALNTYLSYYSADTLRYPDPLSHYVDTYFGFVDFADPGYNELSWTYEAGRSYAGNLTGSLDEAELARVVLEQTGRWPAGSRARFLARSGALAALVTDKHPATGPVADALTQEYATVFPGPVAILQRQAAALRSFLIGAAAPTFTGLTPEGDSLHLTDLRGQYVLLDFWASWCGPCRRENPNVVRMYKKYRDRGFEILGVSLDDRRERWLQAIDADQLDWQHVSDLKGWRSDFAQLYGVTSIPQTVLLDPTGKIVARNLRGADLERKLEEILGTR